MQMVRAGLKAIYLSGWQVAADANTAGSMYPYQSLYPANSGPELARKINRTLQRAVLNLNGTLLGFIRAESVDHLYHLNHRLNIGFFQESLANLIAISGHLRGRRIWDK